MKGKPTLLYYTLHTNTAYNITKFYKSISDILPQFREDDLVQWPPLISQSATNTNIIWRLW